MSTDGLMEESMKESMLRIEKRATVAIYGQTAGNMKDGGEEASNMDLAPIWSPMRVARGRGSGKTERELSGLMTPQ